MRHALYFIALGIPAMILHECGHVATAAALGVRVKRVGISRRGLFTVRAPGSTLKNALITLAGPFVNLTLAFAFWHTDLGVVNLVAAIYNLLPLEASDGSRLLALAKEVTR